MSNKKKEVDALVVNAVEFGGRTHLQAWNGDELYGTYSTHNGCTKNNPKKNRK